MALVFCTYSLSIYPMFWGLALQTYEAVLKLQEQLWGVANQIQQLGEFIAAEFRHIEFEILTTDCDVVYGE